MHPLSDILSYLIVNDPPEPVMVGSNNPVSELIIPVPENNGLPAALGTLLSKLAP